MNVNTAEGSPLGRTVEHVEQVDPGLLYPIDRAEARTPLGLGAALPFVGADLWTAYELSWLNPRGKPQLAIAHITVPCESPKLIESKSLKLYLGSYAQTVIASVDELQQRLRADLAEALWRGDAGQGSIGLKLVLPEAFENERIREPQGLSLDRLDLDCSHYQPAPELLRADPTQAMVHETLYSRLLRSRCPVTGQPDWGTVELSYAGHPIDQAGLLAYIVSFRQHPDFHEACVERIFLDVMARCRPARLSVLARYTRRGGLDINPWRSSHPQPLPANVRQARQ